MKAWVIPGEGVVEEEPSYTPDHGARLDAETLLALLPRKERTAVVSRFMEGDDIQDISRRLRVFPWRVVELYSEALKKMRRWATRRTPEGVCLLLHRAIEADAAKPESTRGSKVKPPSAQKPPQPSPRQPAPPPPPPSPPRRARSPHDARTFNLYLTLRRAGYDQRRANSVLARLGLEQIEA